MVGFSRQATLVPPDVLFYQATKAKMVWKGRTGQQPSDTDTTSVTMTIPEIVRVGISEAGARDLYEVDGLRRKRN